jgi:hypothetical protein
MIGWSSSGNLAHCNFPQVTDLKLMHLLDFCQLCHIVLSENELGLLSADALRRLL